MFGVPALHHDVWTSLDSHRLSGLSGRAAALIRGRELRGTEV